MGGKFVTLVAITLLCSWVSTVVAKEKPASSSSAVSITALTADAFQQLPADAMLEVNGERMTKRDYIARAQAAINDAQQKMRAWSTRTTTEFQARRQAFLASQQTKVNAANQKVQVEVDKALAADAAAHGPNWEANRKQAAKLLDQAAKASGQKQLQLVTEALDLLKPVSPQRQPTGKKP